MRTLSRIIVLGAGFALSVSGCNCGVDGPGLGRVGSDIQLEPAQLDFGPVALGSTATLPVTITNVGTHVLKLCVARGPGCSEVIAPLDSQAGLTVVVPAGCHGAGGRGCTV